jgi:hypothetical protein
VIWTALVHIDCSAFCDGSEAIPGVSNMRPSWNCGLAFPERKRRCASFIRAHVAIGFAEVAALVFGRTAHIITGVDGRAASLERMGQRVAAVIGQG